MKLRSLIPVLDVRDVETSIEFYCDVLGFTVQEKVAWGGRTEWALLRGGQVQLMLCAGEPSDSDDDGRRCGEGVFFLYHENVESLLVYLGARGYEGLSNLMQPTTARDFFLRDPDGYVLWFSHKPVGSEECVEVVLPAPAHTHA
jgi:catechol 2,3-dioxygenase-like lactoylglutathione lyase family enzyme